MVSGGMKKTAVPLSLPHEVCYDAKNMLRGWPATQDFTGGSMRHDCQMNLQDCYVEEDLFPKIFTGYEERDYGILFFNTENKDSFDSNHAVIYRDRIHDLPRVLADITGFYQAKGSRPIIYQSMLDDNWFDEIKGELAAAGYESWVEDQEYMLPSGSNRIIHNPEITVTKVSEWNDEIENVFVEAEELWEIMVAKKTLAYPKGWMFAASINNKTVGLLYGHRSEKACRVDYLLVSKQHRKTGAGRALFYHYVEWCKQNGIENTYIWPDGDTPKRIYEEGGYRIVEVRKAGRAVLNERVTTNTGLPGTGKSKTYF